MTADALVAIMADPNSDHRDVTQAWETYHMATLHYIPSQPDHWVRYATADACALRLMKANETVRAEAEKVQTAIEKHLKDLAEFADDLPPAKQQALTKLLETWAPLPVMLTKLIENIPE